MPTSYVKKVAKDLKLPVSEVEDYWSKAKEIAAERFDSKQKAYWAYVVGIFKNMLSISASDEALLTFTSESARNSKWWESLTHRQQKAYIKEHPNSKYAKLTKTKEKDEFKPKDEDSTPEETQLIDEKDQIVARNIVQMNEDKIEEGIEDDIGVDELEKGLDVLNSLTPEEPEEEPSKDLNADEEEDTEDDLSDLDVPDEEEEEDTEPTEEEPTNDLNADEEEDTEEESEEQGEENTEPTNDLNADEEEEEPKKNNTDNVLTPENIKIAKAVIGSLAKNVLGALAVALLFTPLLPIALEIGDMYWKYLRGEAEDDEEEYEEEAPVKPKKKKKKKVQASARKDTKYFVNDFTEWLLKQDIKKLTAKK